VNFPYLSDLQARHVAWIVERALREGIRTLEVTPEAEADWVARVVSFSDRTRDFGESCTPGYYNNEGRPTDASRQSGFYFGGPTEFADLLEAWREEGTMRGLERS
jgi:hypothetical protein